MLREIHRLILLGEPTAREIENMKRDIRRALGHDAGRRFFRRSGAHWQWLLHAWLFRPWEAETLLDVITWGTFARKPTAKERRQARERRDAIRKGRIEAWRLRRRAEAVREGVRRAVERRREEKQHNSQTVNNPTEPPAVV